MCFFRCGFDFVLFFVDRLCFMDCLIFGVGGSRDFFCRVRSFRSGRYVAFARRLMIGFVCIFVFKFELSVGIIFFREFIYF